jgi:hypothetical protein
LNSFAEYAPESNPETKKKDVVWFALNDDKPLFAFAGIWTTFNGERGTKSKPVPGPHQSTAFSRHRADPSEGHARDPDHRRRAGRVNARPVG